MHQHGVRSLPGYFIYIDALHERWKGTPHQKSTVSDCHGGTTGYKLDAMHIRNATE